MVNVLIPRDAAEYILGKRMARPNVIIYRDVVFAAASAAPGAFIFSPKVRVSGKEPNEMFTVLASSYHIPIWVERGLLSQMNSNESFIVALRGGIIKRLKIEKCSQLEELGTEQIGGK